VTIMNPKIAQTSPPHNSTTMGSIEAAIAAIESLEPDEDFCYKEIAAAYGVDRVTLSRRHQEVQASHTTKSINQQKLTPPQEAELIKYIDKLTEQGLPPTRQIIRNFAA
jgi:hypothetical protein